jgi:nifR3 family TIM-barrel protein
MTTKYRPGLVYCEMVKMDALIRHDPGTYRLLDFEPSMHPIGGQLCGSKPELAGPCAKIIEDLGFDVLDLNCGCPVDKVTKDGSGSGMLKTLDLIGTVLNNMVAAVKIPVTVKIRAGWDALHIVGPEITRIAEEAGASAICIHGRTRAQGYKGPANWDFIRDCKQASKKIPVIGNGDIVDGPSAKKMFEYTGCDALLLARGTMGKPWLTEDIYRYLSNEEPLSLTGVEYRDILLEHVDHIISYQDEKRAVQNLRKIGCWFLRGAPNMRHLRVTLNQLTSATEVRAMICDYPWHEVDLSAVDAEEEDACEQTC